MCSDNGSCFTAQDTQQFAASKFIDWRFNIALAPWQGGIWERLVSCIKRCIKKAVGVRKISYTELQTMIFEIEAILNNRPLCQDYDDELDDVLTPNHLVYGRRLENVNEKSVKSVELEGRVELVKREKHLVRLVTYFWNVWRKEYLTELRESQKSTKTKGDETLSIDNIVIVYDRHQPRHLWKLGRVTGLIKGEDGVTRGAKLKFGNSGVESTRPLNRLYPLEICGSEKQVPTSNTTTENQVPTSNTTTENRAPTNHSVTENDETKLPRPKRKAAVVGEMKRRREYMD